ncbi:MAG: ABC transporter ATP-binding protein [Elusimicrobia bacterium]|nr:ABC transporter ATP-binding protein [Elusimicrobiota bacterium]
MISVQDLTKRYDDTLAVDGISFEVQAGEVVGLLGPNGAGKTTALRILTGYLPPTSGTAHLAGYDIFEDSLEVRRRVGYLAETNPLYEDFSVLECLEIIARLRGLSPAQSRRRIQEVIGLCALPEVMGKDVTHLSKGYRQRLGLALAILHDPEILILDEPTSGLDPNQQREVRDLIQALKTRKTVLLSTHILSEAQVSCDRILIIHRGKIAASGTPQELQRLSAGPPQLSVQIRGPAQAILAGLNGVPGVTRVTLRGEDGGAPRFLLEAAPGADPREAVFNLAVQFRWTLLELKMETASLEEIFRQLTIEEGGAVGTSPSPGLRPPSPSRGEGWGEGVKGQ